MAIAGGKVRCFIFAAAVLAVSLMGGPHRCRGDDRSATPSTPLTTVTEAVYEVFARHPLDKKEFSVFSRRPVTSSVRPLQQSTFAPLRKYFSLQQQNKIDDFINALNYLIALRDKHAKRWNITATWWWPVSTAHIETALTGDLLTNRRATPDQITISPPIVAGQKVKITVRETYKETASDGTNLGNVKLADVVLVQEGGRWVIEEILFHATNGPRREEHSLSQILHDHSELLRKTAGEISKLPKTPKTRGATSAAD